MPAGSQTSEAAGNSHGRDNLFLWTVFLLLLAGLGFACWLGSFYVFGHPEQERPYRILKKLGKLPPPTRFPVTKAPPGEFLGAQRVFEQYSKFTTLQLRHENELLFRAYLKNYTENKRPVPYLIGKFLILKTYELQSSDLVTSGVVALAQSEDYPQLLAELVYPTSSGNVAELEKLLVPGLEVRLEKTLDLSAILHVGHSVDGRLQVTSMPLLYGSYAIKNGAGTFSLEPPTALNVAAGFPLVRGEEVRSVMREQLEIRRKKMIAKTPPPADSAAIPQLVRVDLEGPAAAIPPLGPLVPSAVVAKADKAEGSVQPEVPAAIPVPAPAAFETSAALPVAGPSQSKNGGVTALPPPGGGNAGVTAGKALPATAPTPSAAGVASAAPSKASAPSVKPDTNTGASAAKVEASVPKAELVTANTGGAQRSSAGATVPSGASTTAKASKGSSMGSGAAPITAGAVVAASTGPQPNAIASTSVNKPPASGGTGASAPETKPAGEAKPFVAAAPAGAPRSPTGSWKTYNPGQQPGGRVISAEQATALAGRTDIGRNYLRGEFLVKASGANRAVLRQSKTDDRTPPIRVIVEYPAGAVPPAQGSAIARDDGRGFEIREVRKSEDGQINIFVREVNAQ